MKKLFLLIAVLLCTMSFASAYYADAQIDVDSSGFVSIEGLTNHPTLLVKDSAEFTSKEGKFWLLNISINDNFENLAYEISLPKGTIVNYMKLPDFGRIEEKGGIVISGAATDSTLNIVVQYNVEKISSSFPWWIVILFIVLGATWFASYKLMASKNKVKEQTLDLSTFSPRQKMILKYLQQNDGELTQAKLETLTGFPKSSLSRNINSLVRKEVVEKHNIGMSNAIRLKKPKIKN